MPLLPGPIARRPDLTSRACYRRFDTAAQQRAPSWTGSVACATRRHKGTSSLLHRANPPLSDRLRIYTDSPVPPHPPLLGITLRWQVFPWEGLLRRGTSLSVFAVPRRTDTDEGSGGYPEQVAYEPLPEPHT